MALISKLLLLACCCRLAIVCIRHVALSHAFKIPLFLLFVLAVSFAHNIAFVNSFYGRFASGLSGALRAEPMGSGGVVPVGLLFCSGAKPQYSYLAALTAAVLAPLTFMDGRKIDVVLIGLALIAFIVGW
jgi:hypothetical protein